jgi:hypothetical protein
MPGQARQQPPVHGLQLADVPEAEGAQEAAQRGGRPHLPDNAGQRAVAEPVHVLDAVGAQQHPGDQALDFQRRARAERAGHGHVLAGQPARPASRITGSSPAAEIRFGSSNTKSVPEAAYWKYTCQVPSRLG